MKESKAYSSAELKTRSLSVILAVVDLEVVSDSSEDMIVIFDFKRMNSFV